MSNDTIDRLSLLIRGIDALIAGLILDLVISIFYTFSMIALTGLLIHLSPVFTYVGNAVESIITLALYMIIFRWGFGLLVKADPKDYDIGLVGVFIIAFASLLSLLMNIMAAIRVHQLIVNLIDAVGVVEGTIGQVMIIISLYRLGYYSNILRRSSIFLMLGFALVYLGTIAVVLHNYLAGSDLLLTGAFIAVPSYILVIWGLNDARRTITNLIIELGKPGGSGLFGGRT
ncbi:hypothetical protein [Vulcanisaeta sp. JCM 14467]